MLGNQGYNDGRIFRPLGFMHGNRIGHGELIKFSNIIIDGSTVIINRQLSFLAVYAAYGPDVPIINLLLIWMMSLSLLPDSSSKTKNGFIVL